MTDQGYFIKFSALFLFTLANVFVIWSFIIREENPDWNNSQVAHQVSPYAITENNSGTIVSNLIMGYEFRLPLGFKTTGARNLKFFIEEDGQKKCEIRHYYINANKLSKLSSEAGKVIFLLNNVKLVFEFMGQETEKIACAKYLKQIEDSIIMDY